MNKNKQTRTTKETSTKKHTMLENITLKFMKVISLSTDVPACLSIKVLFFFFSKNGPNSPKYGKIDPIKGKMWITY